MPYICWIAKFDEHGRVTIIGRFSVLQFWLWTLTLTSQERTIFDTDDEHLCHISRKSDLNLSNYHNERNQPTNERTNEPTNAGDHNTSWWGGGGKITPL